MWEEISTYWMHAFGLWSRLECSEKTHTIRDNMQTSCRKAFGDLLTVRQQH